MDYAATTPIDAEVVQAMLPFVCGEFGNPSSIYRTGRAARRAIDEARDAVAEIIGAESSREIIFTSGGSEADNLAVKGVAWASRAWPKRGHIVASAIEHSAVLSSVAFLENEGFAVTYAMPDASGIVYPEAVEEAVRDDTVLISVMHANNETGVVQPVEAIAAIARERGIPFHVDAVQTVGRLDVNVQALGCDLLSLSAHKFGGPKGAGALYARRKTPLAPLMHGGGQEQERRGGTENVAGIVGLAKALERSVVGMEEREGRVRDLRDRLERGILQALPQARLNGHPSRRLAGHLNLTFPGVDGESLLLNLDMAGIEASSGSACTAGSLEASHVLLAMGLSKADAMSSLRFSLGDGNDMSDVDRVIATLPPLVERLSNRV